MKNFLKKLPAQIASTYACIMFIFIAVRLLKGFDSVATVLLLQLALVAVIGGIWQEFCFGSCFIKQMADVKRLALFVIPFATVTLLLALLFDWMGLNAGALLRFCAIFVACSLLSLILFEIEHRIQGKKYTAKLKEYQKEMLDNEHKE